MSARSLLLACVLLAAGDTRANPPDAVLAPAGRLGVLPRFGVNLGGRTVWGAEQLLSNVLRNPGLEAVQDGGLVIVGRVGRNDVDDDSRWTARPAGFWAGAEYEVLSGAAAGQHGGVVDNHRSDERQPDRLLLQPMPTGLQIGDVIALRGAVDAAVAPMWWTEGAVRAMAQPRPGSPGQRSVLLVAAAGRPAALLHHLDSIGTRAGKLLPVRGRWRLALWLRALSPDAHVQLGFGRAGRPRWLDQRVLPARDWQAAVFEFETQDDGPAGPLQLSIRVEHGEVAVDDVELAIAGQAGEFRSEVVSTLKALRPGYLRDWQGQLADTPANRTATPMGRRPMRYRPGADELLFGYSLAEFFALCAEVGARPWVVLPATTTVSEARAFGQALTVGWERHRFDEIVVEHGNEHWNSMFRPAGIADPVRLAEVADRAFVALREGAGPTTPLHRVIGTHYADSAAAGRMAARSRASEGVAVAPYFHYRQESTDSLTAALDRALHEDLLPLRQALAGAASSGRSVDVYEVNFHTTLGSATSAQRDAVLASDAAGAALARRLLQAAALGVRRQAVYTLAGFDTFVSGPDRSLVQLFGITRDLTAAAQWRPTGRALAALNAVAGGTAEATACTGQPCGEITALAFDGGSRWALVSAAPTTVRVSVPCRATLWLRSSAGVLPDAPCVAGRAMLPLASRAWLTATPRGANGATR